MRQSSACMGILLISSAGAFAQLKGAPLLVNSAGALAQQLKGAPPRLRPSRSWRSDKLLQEQGGAEALRRFLAQRK